MSVKSFLLVGSICHVPVLIRCLNLPPSYDSYATTWPYFYCTSKCRLHMDSYLNAIHIHHENQWT
jgi:hypothetical protein